MAIDGLILDFGEVLVRPQSTESVTRLANLARMDSDAFRASYWQHRIEYDAGRLPGTAYWRRVLAESSIAPGEADSTIAALKDADYESWTDYREEMWELTARFKATGRRTAVLSNGVPEVMGRVALERALDTYFDAVVVSCDVGCAKPEARIYQICLERLGLPASSTLFVDDRVENLEGAARQGIQTLHFTGAESVARLRELIGL